MANSAEIAQYIGWNEVWIPIFEIGESKIKIAKPAANDKYRIFCSTFF